MLVQTTEYVRNKHCCWKCLVNISSVGTCYQLVQLSRTVS